jgi:hypothetical protein
MKTKFIFPISLLILVFLSTLGSKAQTYFQKVYQSSPYNQEGMDVVSMPDGGYLIAGYTTNSTANDADIMVIKTDAFGSKIWSKTYGGAKPDFPYHMLPTNDGNYFIIGYSQSYGGGDVDILLLKIDASGNQKWLKTYGGTGNDQGRDIIATADGNYMIVGSSNSYGLTNQNANLIKIDTAGVVKWNKTYGGNSDDFGNSVKQCNDGGFIMLGQTFSYGVGNGDAYLIKTAANGDTLWTKTFGGLLSDEGVYVTANNDNTFTFVIRDSSNVGKDIDIRIVKTDVSGNLTWSKTYGGYKKDTPKMIQPTSDGGYVVAGHSRSFGWINPDMWILKLNNTGDTTWTKHYGGNNHEHCYVVREQIDGSYIAVGKTESFGPDMDPIFLKLNMNGNLITGIEEQIISSNDIDLYPNPNEGILNIDLTNFKAIKITVTDILGVEIYRRELNNNEENINIKLYDKKPGVYFVKGESETQSVIKKFIIN